MYSTSSSYPCRWTVSSLIVIGWMSYLDFSAYIVSCITNKMGICVKKRVNLVFHLAGLAYPLKMLGSVVFCVHQHVFMCVYRTDPEQQPQLSSTRKVAALSLAHTHAKLFPVICTLGDKSPFGETETVGDNPQWGKASFWGCWKSLWRGLVCMHVWCVWACIHTGVCVTKICLYVNACVQMILACTLV